MFEAGPRGGNDLGVAGHGLSFIGRPFSEARPFGKHHMAPVPPVAPGRGRSARFGVSLATMRLPPCVAVPARRCCGKCDQRLPRKTAVDGGAGDPALTTSLKAVPRILTRCWPGFGIRGGRTRCRWPGVAGRNDAAVRFRVRHDRILRADLSRSTRDPLADGGRRPVPKRSRSAACWSRPNARH